MWVANPYLIAGIVVVANARAIPNLIGYIDKRQFGSMNSQSSSSSSGYSSSSQTTSDGRVSRTTTIGGTPYTITQTSQSSPVIGQGTSISTLQIGQNPPQIIQDPFPRVPMPFQTNPYASRPLQPIGMPMLPPLPALPMPPLSFPMPPLSIPMPSFPMALGFPTQTSTFMQTLPVAPQNLIPAQTLNSPQAIASPAQIPTGSVVTMPTPAATIPQATTPLAQASSAVRTQNTPQAVGAQTTKVIDSPAVPPKSQSLPPQASRVSPQVSNTTQALDVSQPAFNLTGLAQGSNGPSQDTKLASLVSDPNVEEKTNQTTQPTKAVVSDINGEEKAEQTSRTPSLEASPRLSNAPQQPPQAPANGPAPPPATAAKPPPSIAAQNATPQANTESNGPPRNFPVVGLPVGPHTQEIVSTKPLPGNQRPERPTGFALNNNPVAQTYANGVWAGPGSQAKAQKTPTNPPPPGASTHPPGPAVSNGPANNTRLETGVIPVLIEGFTPEGQPVKSDGILKISNLVPVA